MNHFITLLLLIMTLLVTGCTPTLVPAAQAIAEKNTASLKKELDTGLSPHYVIPKSEVLEGHSLMDLAVMYDSHEAIDLLAERGADVNKSVFFFDTTHKEPHLVMPTVNTLLKHQINPTLLLPKSCAQQSVMKFLLDKGAKVDGEKGTVPPLSSCIILYSTYNEYIKTLPQYTYLYAPVRDNALQSAYLLIENGANVNAAKQKGKSIPLELAIISGNMTLVETILKKGGEVNHADENGVTPLMHASSRKLDEIVKLLLAKGANPLPRDKNGMTAADHAQKHNYTSTYNLLAQAASVAPSLTQPLHAPKEPSQELQTLLKSKNQAQLRSYLDTHPDEIHAIKDPVLQLLYTGPKELRIADIIELVKMKKKDAIIIAQINAVGGPYKGFSLKEMTQLEKMGLTDDVVAAMITITTQHQQKQLALAQTQPKPSIAQQPVTQPIQQQPLRQAAQAQESAVVDTIVEGVAKEVGSRLIRQLLPF